MNNMKNFVLNGVVMLALPFLMAANGTDAGLGRVAGNLMEPVGFFSDFIQTGCLLIGSAFVFAGIVKYFEHRRSPLMVPISTVVFLFIAGIVLLLLPLLSYFSGMGVTYSLLKR